MILTYIFLSFRPAFNDLAVVSVRLQVVDEYGHLQELPLQHLLLGAAAEEATSIPLNEEVKAWHAQLKSAKSLNARTKTQGKHKAYDKGRDWGLEKATRAYDYKKRTRRCTPRGHGRGGAGQHAN